jgi:hypothetical protein
MSWKALVLLSAISVLLPGCGTRLPTVPLSGKVTWQGQPLGNGKVTFTPIKLADESLPKRPAIAELGPDGVYHVASFRENDGLVPGEYSVTVHSYKSVTSLETPNVPTVWRIPERYGDPSTSGLKFTVPANASRGLVFDIGLK